MNASRAIGVNVKRKAGTILVLLVIAAVGWLQQNAGDRVSTSVDDSDGAARLERAFEEHATEEWIEARALVARLLSDDADGSRHQRFIVTTTRGQSLLIAHNIDLAERVPVALGDRIEFRGSYEWNERGGVIHWTHHDPQGRIPGGYIVHRGKTYR